MWGISFMLERETTQTADQGPQSDAQWQRKWDRGDSRDVGLEAAIISKVRNSLPVEPSCAENDGDSSVVPQSRILGLPKMVGERRRPQRSGTDKEPWSVVECMPERVTTRRVGSPSAESTRFPGEGQSAQGQSGPKARPKGVADGQTVNIPSPVRKG